MNKYRPFTRFGLLAVAVVMAFTTLLAAPARPSVAADADTFYLSWPYEPPPKGNLNVFSPDALTNGGFGMWSYLLQPTMGYYVAATGKYYGWLADKWGFSADGKKYTITLAKDLTWSTGTPITSKDVVGTFNLFRVTASSVYTNGVAKVVAVDDYTIDYLLEKPPSVILERSIMKEIVVSHDEYGTLMDKAGQLLADGEKAGKALADIKGTDDWKALDKALADFRPTATVSSGPYTLDIKDVQTAQLVMRRTDKTKFGKLAKFDKIVVYKGDTEVTTPLILSGDLYYATDYFPPPVEKSFTDKGITIMRAPSLGGPAVFFNFAVPPLDKLEIRQAFAYAIDRERVTKVSYAQIGKPVVHMADYSDDRLKNFLTDDQIKTFNTYAYDRTKADELMQKAGYKKNGDFYADASGKTLELELSAPADFTDWMPAAQDVVDQLNDFGVKVTLRAVPNSQHAPDVRAGKFQLAIRLWGYPNPLPWYAFRYLYQQNAVAKTDKDAGMSYPLKKTIGGKDYDFVALIGKLSEGTDPAPQKEAFFALTTAFNQDLPTIPLVERFYNTPLVTTNINVPPMDDPTWGNVSGSDNAIVVFLMDGRITPKAK